MLCLGLWEHHTHWFWITPFFFAILMVICGALMCRSARRRRVASGRWGVWGLSCCSDPGRAQRFDTNPITPARILDQRYAAGEINREEYERMKRDIKSVPDDRKPAGG